MSWIHPIYNKLSSILLISGIILLLAASGYGAKKKDTEVMNEAELQVRVLCFLRAITDAATTDIRLEKAWKRFLNGLDEAACARIEADQEQRLNPEFDARPVAIALNRLNAYMLTQAFGQRSRSQTEPVREALARVYISTLYGSEWFGNESSDLVRTSAKSEAIGEDI